jgi:hypothetical protein
MYLFQDRGHHFPTQRQVVNQDVCIISLLQTIAIQNQQIQLALNSKSSHSTDDPVSSNIISRRRRFEGYQIGGKLQQNTTNAIFNNIPLNEISTIPKEVKKRVFRDPLKRKWKLYIWGIVFFLRISKKFRIAYKQEQELLKILDDGKNEYIDMVLQNEKFIHLKSTIKSIAAEGGDFLIKEGLAYLFQKKPSKVQIQKLNDALLGFFAVIPSVDDC